MPQPYGYPVDGKSLEEQHSELVRLYKEYCWQIRAFWHKLAKNERARLFLEHFKNQPLHRHGDDAYEKQRSAMFPDINLNDVSTSAKYLLNHMKHRATVSLFEQCWAGLDGALGDGPFIIEKVDQNQLIPKENPNFHITFAEDWYGDIVKFKKENEETQEKMKTLVKGGYCVSYGIGTLIITRQYTLLIDFRFFILEMLEKIPRSWWTKAQWERVKQERPAALDQITKKLKESMSTAGKAPEKMSIAQLLNVVQNRRDSLKDYLAILRDEPSVLVYNVNSWLLSRPELVTDDKGRHLPLETDKHTSCAIFEAVRGWIQKFAIWSYICDLLEMLDNEDTEPDYKRVVLQEISNVCHFEYSRAQAHFIRHVQTGLGARCFRRVTNAYNEAGDPRVVMKVKPEELPGRDSLLQCMVRLCQSRTHASQAVELIKKLDELYKSKPCAWKLLPGRQMDALDELLIIVSVIQEFSKALSLPPLSRKTGQTFLEGSRELNSGLNDIREKVDLQQFSVPITTLLGPGMATQALAKLDDSVIRNTGSKMDFFYHYNVQECLAYHRAQSRKTKDAPEEMKQNTYPVVMAFSIAMGVDLKKYEENRSPAQTSTPENEQAANKPNEEQLQQLYANLEAKKVLSTLFKNPKAGASITWAAFESTMVAMGFSVKQGQCGKYALIPPANMPTEATLPVARPLNSKIEGHLIPILARRLKKAYGKFLPLD